MVPGEKTLKLTQVAGKYLVGDQGFRSTEHRMYGVSLEFKALVLSAG